MGASLEWSFGVLTYGGDGQPKESGGERQEVIGSLPPQRPLPLYIAGRDEERNKDAYTTDFGISTGVVATTRRN